ncbi:hypothetical protein [Thermococcus thioreducens]|uniref:Uncharacterized protein n=1 Tax=Thermococcus thioreducens TaxID=277988 RepID=A0A0Q2XLB6_9EURY|nr:hypothetical protein [Thermococcus thioreducens]ASJ11778.1 hypothetical protein A3L14_02230 [Thermococcus thioreducens]KQH81932.1 hypothetical protein AMR53_08305 [Thermococcus thioreducens]SEW14000.1 hypothetical protein SAMN05216170_1834 [Thermococcus thioreducens]
MRLEKVHVKSERLWRLGLFYLALSIPFLAIGLTTNRVVFPLVNVSVALLFLVLANRLRAIRVSCEGKTFLLVPDYLTSSLVIRDSSGEIFRRELFPPVGKREIETPCGKIIVEVTPHRFGKVDLVVKAGEGRIRIP